MRVKSFRIRNYKSIIDSGECRLSDNDNITILAGQNESGKSSILQALRDFETEDINIDSYRDDDSSPEVTFSWTVGKDELDFDSINDDNQFPESFRSLLHGLSELVIVKTFTAASECLTIVNNDMLGKIKVLVEEENISRKIKNEKILAGEIQNEEEVQLLDTDQILYAFSSALFVSTPRIIFFDDFCDILPDQIFIKDLKAKNVKVRGYQAVKNIETILNADFAKLDQLNDGRRETTQNTYNETITAVFNEKWKQRIAEGDGAKIHVKYYQGKAEDASYLKFYIETKKGEYLSVGKRSQGFKWFLSFFLQLKAEDKRSNELLILFDEPGMYLHSKAQIDMISVLEELAQKDQIIYSTHSPYLIDAAKLHRVRLVMNTKKLGTTIEKITNNKLNKQCDALKPIIDAIGLEVASAFNLAHKNNVILEGISDFHYMQGMKMVLKKDYDLAFLPSMGAPNTHLLMELCIGWGINWVIIYDEKGSTNVYNKIKRHFFNNSDEEINKKVFIIKGCDGIEDIFCIDDLKLINDKLEYSGDRKNSRVVEDYGGKELFARIFFEKVVNGQINKAKLSNGAIKRFQEIFSFVEKSFDIK